MFDRLKKSEYKHKYKLQSFKLLNTLTMAEPQIWNAGQFTFKYDSSREILYGRAINDGFTPIHYSRRYGNHNSGSTKGRNSKNADAERGYYISLGGVSYTITREGMPATFIRAFERTVIP
jgi:hypothetical protein